MTITIANAKDLPPVAEWPEWYVYVGRQNNRRGLRASPLANPFTPEAWGGRAQCILAYTKALEITSGNAQSAETRELARLRALLATHGELVLVCWCHPLPCHAEVIRAALLQGEAA